MATQNFVVKGGLTVGTANIVASNGAANFGALTLSGNANLGPAANITITGGSTNQILTYGAGSTLQWADPTIGSSLSNGTSNVNISTDRRAHV